MDRFYVAGEFGATQALIDEWKSLDYKKKVAALVVAFPYEVYE